MIKFENVSYGFPTKDLYNDICFEIEEGEHAVLIGRNGTGKTTLVNMIVNTEDYLYDGKIIKDSDMRIGYISQFVKHESEEITAFEYLAKSFVDMLAASDAICAQMETAEDMDEVYARYQTSLDEIEAVDGYNYDSNIRKQLAIAGIEELAEKQISMVSGGEFKLLSIIKTMMFKPELLIMDEPDAFLDFENIVSLSKLINNYSGTILAITHSRLLLSQCFNKVLHIENMELQEFPGTFAEYNRAMLETKIGMQEQATKDLAEIEAQQKLIEQLRNSATQIDSPTKGKQLKARVSYLERLLKRQAKNPFIESLDYVFTFPEVEEVPTIKVENYSLTYDKTILSDVSFEILPGEKVALVGANGTGKSSLLKDVYESMKDCAAYFEQIYDNDETVLSGGERNIAQIEKIAGSDAKILFLDEPTSHLDTYACMALENAVREYKGSVLMVTHDFYTVANCADRIFILENGTLREVSARAYRKSIYNKYFDSDIFENERIRREKEVRINALLLAGKYEDAKKVL